MEGDYPTFTEMEDGSTMITFRPKEYAAKRQQLVADGLSQLLIVADLAALTKFRRAAPPPVPVPPPPPPLPPYPYAGAQYGGPPQAPAQAPAQAPEVALTRGRRSLSPLEVVLATGAVPPNAAARVRACADTDSACEALSGGLRGVPAARLHGAVAEALAGQSPVSPLREGAEDVVRLVGQRGVPTVVLATGRAALYDVALRCLLGQILPPGSGPAGGAATGAGALLADLPMPPTMLLAAGCRLEVGPDGAISGVENHGAQELSVATALADLRGGGGAASLCAALTSRRNAVLVSSSADLATHATQGAAAVSTTVRLGFFEPPLAATAGGGNGSGGLAAALGAFEDAGFDAVMLGDASLGPLASLLREVATGKAPATNGTAAGARAAEVERRKAAEQAERDRLLEIHSFGY